ncbi:MAG: hypothetical protein M3237_14125 [Actinomycetota bacterium]|nr:hypothetical protein [Actinomycetota bacterium]
MRRRRLTRHPGIVLLLLALLLTPFVAACGASGDDDSPGVATLDESGDGDGSDDGTDTAGSEDDLEEQALEFAQCMRENGVPDFPDPQVDGGRITMGGPGGGDQIDPEAAEKAMEACEELAPRGGGNFDPEERQEMQDAFLDYAQCMRDNGYDMPDPDFSDGGGMFRLQGEPDDPAFVKAQAACEDKLPGRPGDEG